MVGLYCISIMFMLSIYVVCMYLHVVKKMLYTDESHYLEVHGTDLRGVRD